MRGMARGPHASPGLRRGGAREVKPSLAALAWLRQQAVWRRGVAVDNDLDALVVDVTGGGAEIDECANDQRDVIARAGTQFRLAPSP